MSENLVDEYTGILIPELLSSFQYHGYLNYERGTPGLGVSYGVDQRAKLPPL